MQLQSANHFETERVIFPYESVVLVNFLQANDRGPKIEVFLRGIDGQECLRGEVAQNFLDGYRQYLNYPGGVFIRSEDEIQNSIEELGQELLCDEKFRAALNDFLVRRETEQINNAISEPGFFGKSFFSKTKLPGDADRKIHTPVQPVSLCSRSGIGGAHGH